jgi:LAO/AO transport system kinase
LNNPSINPSYEFHPVNVPDPKVLFDKIRQGDRVALAQAITLIESLQSRHHDAKFELLRLCAAVAAPSVRIGITGVPGAGKSTLIEAFGNYLLKKDHRLAVLAIDPSSSRSKGSILGDKTRMQTLSTHPGAFIRPTASGGNLGGTAAFTREVILLCETAGFDLVIVETVGVGQSETLVNDLTDLFLLLAVPGTGDELQGIKRGIMEMADIIAINKTDGDNLAKAKQAAAHLKNALHLFPVAENDWMPKVMNVSALEQKGLDELYELIQAFVQQGRINGHFAYKRQQQDQKWLDQYIMEMVRQKFMGQLSHEAYEKLKTDALKQKNTVLEAAVVVVKKMMGDS